MLQAPMYARTHARTHTHTHTHTRSHKHTVYMFTDGKKKMIHAPQRYLEFKGYKFYGHLGFTFSEKRNVDSLYICVHKEGSGLYCKEPLNIIYTYNLNISYMRSI